jgi:hypothetical protein
MARRVCFFVMPFRSELNFFYLYLKKYLEDKHGVEVRRGDTSILTKALMDKIETEIQSADLIVGDVTHSNPNVFYELGIARANRKPIVFLTQEDPEKAPVDLRQFEFIRYDLAKDHDLLQKLDNAIRNLLGEGYRELFNTSLALLQKFNAATGSAFIPAEFEEFQARVMRGERLEGIPAPEKQLALEEFLLPKIVGDATDMSTIRKIENWLSRRDPPAQPG